MYNATKPYKKKILELIESTWNTPYIKVTKGVYPHFVANHGSKYEIDHTDGIGSKGVLHWEKRTFREAVQDAIAMNINDLTCAWAAPYKLQAHLILPQDNHKAILEILEFLCEVCKSREIAITGGETAIHDNLEGMELSLTVSGFVENIELNKAQVGDLVVGRPSSGPHSNGYTLLRKLLHDPPTTPTTVYSNGQMVNAHSITHLAGGAFSRLVDVLEPNQDMILELPPSDEFWSNVFQRLCGYYTEPPRDAARQMLSTFNCGWGMIYTIAADDLALAEESKVLGKIVPGSGLVQVTSHLPEVTSHFKLRKSTLVFPA